MWIPHQKTKKNWCQSVDCWGWVFLGTNADSQWIPVLQRISLKFLWWKQNDLSVVLYVILTRQTCGQRSSKTPEIKHLALGNYFFERICCMFLISKCRDHWDLGLHNFGTYAWRTTAQWQNPIFPASKHVFFPEVTTALRFSKRKSQSCAQT